MKYQWLEDKKTCEELSQELGCKVKSITKGHIIIGYEDSADAEGKPAQVPITKRGVEIEFEKAPTVEQLAKLDATMPHLKRKDSKIEPIKI